MPLRRADRLFELIQLLRGGRHRTARWLAGRLEVSERSIYRDIDSLIVSGLPIQGTRGKGFALTDRIFLPPLSLSEAEFDALRIGASFVSNIGDAELAQAAQELVIKLEEVLPEARRLRIPESVHTIYAKGLPSGNAVGILRAAIRSRTKVRLKYADALNETSERVIRPLQLEYWGKAWTCSAWCELRHDFRVFRIDRILAADSTNEPIIDEPGRSYQDFLAQMANVSSPEIEEG